MQIIGSVSSREEAKEITQIAKFFLIGQRARYLAKTVEDQILEEVFNEQ